jgi:chromosome segregation ATPase
MGEVAELKKEVSSRDRTISQLEAQRTDYEQRMQDLRNSMREAEQNCSKMYSNLTSSSSA